MAATVKEMIFWIKSRKSQTSAQPLQVDRLIRRTSNQMIAESHPTSSKRIDEPMEQVRSELGSQMVNKEIQKKKCYDCSIK